MSASTDLIAIRNTMSASATVVQNIRSCPSSDMDEWMSLVTVIGNTKTYCLLLLMLPLVCLFAE